MSLQSECVKKKKHVQWEKERCMWQQTRASCWWFSLNSCWIMAETWEFVWRCACLSVSFSNIPCLLRLASMFEELPGRLSIELECVHWDRRDWGWGGSFRDRPPTSMQFTFMFGFSPAAHKIHSFIHNMHIRYKIFLFQLTKYSKKWGFQGNPTNARMGDGGIYILPEDERP